MKQLEQSFCYWKHAEGTVAAEDVIPYPPGIPILLKGECIKQIHIDYIAYLIKQETNFQQSNIAEGLFVFKGE
ncbi:hypothetical protein [Amphibacillus cookii]|uniref:Orn/Lys/Arg family decarboxylase n=1 Tax=Amphibacillus cookii TaxID=767787 RepID=UPI00195CE20C|nr:hypothetical protein [Amphibacillus cookii]MBM7543134.1 arginine/lysine/ornithine decarboxylase [Amphibacillus cookii]